MSNKKTNKLLLSKREAAKLLRCSHKKLDILVKKGFLKVLINSPKGFSVKIPITSIESYIESNSYYFSNLS